MQNHRHDQADFYVVVLVSIVTLGTIYALILNARPPGQSVFATIFFIPIVLSSVVIGLLFTQMLSPTVGIVGPLLEKVGFAHLADHQWVGDRSTALPVVMVVYVWRELGFAILRALRLLARADHRGSRCSRSRALALCSG